MLSIIEGNEDDDDDVVVWLVVVELSLLLICCNGVGTAIIFGLLFNDDMAEDEEATTVEKIGDGTNVLGKITWCLIPPLVLEDFAGIVILLWVVVLCLLLIILLLRIVVLVRLLGVVAAIEVGAGRFIFVLFFLCRQVTYSKLC